jgi:hypothetical protein
MVLGVSTGSSEANFFNQAMSQARFSFAFSVDFE